MPVRPLPARVCALQAGMPWLRPLPSESLPSGLPLCAMCPRAMQAGMPRLRPVSGRILSTRVPLRAVSAEVRALPPRLSRLPGLPALPTAMPRLLPVQEGHGGSKQCNVLHRLRFSLLRCARVPPPPGRCGGRFKRSL